MQIHKQIEEAMPRLRAEIAGAVARGYCYVENSKKVLDPDLLKAMGKELEMLFKKELSTIATKSAEKSLKNWYFEDDELVITKGSWVIDRYKKHQPKE